MDETVCSLYERNAEATFVRIRAVSLWLDLVELRAICEFRRDLIISMLQTSLPMLCNVACWIGFYVPRSHAIILPFLVSTCHGVKIIFVNSYLRLSLPLVWRAKRGATPAPFEQANYLPISRTPGFLADVPTRPYDTTTARRVRRPPRGSRRDRPNPRAGSKRRTRAGHRRYSRGPNTHGPGHTQVERFDTSSG